MRLRTALAATPILFLVWLGMGAYLVQIHNSEIAHVQQEAGSLAQAFEEKIRRTVEAVDTTIHRFGPHANGSSDWFRSSILGTREWPDK